MSLLVANGHPDAPHYPLHRLWEESVLLTGNLNSTMATNALLIQMAMLTLFSKDAGTAFSKTIKRLTDE